MIAPQRFQHLSSGGLALLVHGLLLLGLMVGVSWKNPPHLPIEADIWTELPAPPQPLAPPEFAPPPELLPEPAPSPVPPPAVAAEVEAQIALEKIEKKRLADQLRAQAEAAALQKKLEQQQAEEKRLEAVRLVEQQRVEKARLEKAQIEKEKSDLKRRQLDQEMARQMQEELAAETSQLNAMQSRARASNQSRVVRDFQDRIRAKVKDALILPQNLKGDAEVEFQVVLLPNGEVVRVKLLKTSGQPLYDLAVERAIFKASPLPLPSDRAAAQPFREGLMLKFRPSDDAGAVP